MRATKATLMLARTRVAHESSALLRAEHVEAGLLLVAQRAVEVFNSWLHDLDCREHGVDALLHCRKAARRGQHLLLGAFGVENIRGPQCRVLEPAERDALCFGRTDF